MTREELLAQAEALEWALEFGVTREDIFYSARELRAQAEAMNNGAAQGMAQPEGADTTRVEVPAAAPPEYHCNKCGYLGPNQMHERPNGTGICNYFASKINGAATSGAERSSEGTGSPESRTGKPVPVTAAPPEPTPAAPPSVALPVKLWLWKNFVDGRPEYWAFDNPYPIHMDCGDPQTVGEPVGYALVKQSRNGRPDVSEEQVLSSIKRTAPPDLAARVARLEDALRGMLELAEYWFMRENRRGYSEEQYKAWYSLGFDSNEFKNARAALARWEA